MINNIIGLNDDQVNAASEAGLVNGSISSRFDYSHLLHDALAVVGPSGVQIKAISHVIYGQAHSGQFHERGIVKGRSKRSNRRLMNKLSQIDYSGFAAVDERQAVTRSVFVTLTYPANFPDGVESKRDLQNFKKRLERAYNVNWVLWVLEFQRRGAPHYHLVIVFTDNINLPDFRNWLSNNWYELVNSEDIKHLHAGTSVVALYIRDSVGSLMNYLHKEINKGSGGSYQLVNVDANGEILGSGRTWGFWHEDNVDFVVIAVYGFNKEQFEGLKRAISDNYDYGYLAHVHEFASWGGCLLFGDGLLLIDRLFSGLQGLDYISLPEIVVNNLLR